MPDKAVKVSDLMFETVQGGSEGILSVKLTAPMFDGGPSVVSFFLPERQLDRLILQMAWCVQKKQSKASAIWTPSPR
jgi:hypothetical protein